ncbi:MULTISPECIES: hypothetical protein [unclassified Streptomyces]|uniref:hypothetical protein n=1 Tax=unclassified Streptomyces TaxID=2593676 RepID=UPI0033A7E7EE
MGAKGFAGFKKAAAVAGAALALAMVGGQGPAQAQEVQAQVQAEESGVTALVAAVDSIAERVCATRLPVRLPLCGGQGGGTWKPVNGWQIEKPNR